MNDGPEGNPIDVKNADNIEIIKGGDLGNMFLVNVDGKTKHVKNSPANELLYKHGLYEFLYGGENEKRIINRNNPFVAVKPHHREGEYKVWYNDRDIGVITQPSDEKKLLNGVLDSIEENDYGRIKEVYDEILSNQVRRQVISPLSIVYPRDKVVPINEGWVIRGMFKLTWEAEIYLVGKDLEEGDYKRSGGDVIKKDSPQELITISPDETIEPKTVKIGDSQHTLTELEMEFISKVEYLLEFENNIDDTALVNIIRRQISGDVRYADEQTYN